MQNMGRNGFHLSTAAHAIDGIAVPLRQAGRRCSGIELGFGEGGGFFGGGGIDLGGENGDWR